MSYSLLEQDLGRIDLCSPFIEGNGCEGWESAHDMLRLSPRWLVSLCQMRWPHPLRICELFIKFCWHSAWLQGTDAAMMSITGDKSGEPKPKGCSDSMKNRAFDRITIFLNEGTTTNGKEHSGEGKLRQIVLGNESIVWVKGRLMERNNVYCSTGWVRVCSLTFVDMKNQGYFWITVVEGNNWIGLQGKEQEYIIVSTFHFLIFL